MKLTSSNQTSGNRTGVCQQRGYILLALIIVVTLMLFYVAASSRIVYQLQRELTILERAQVKRLVHSPAAAVAPERPTTIAHTNRRANR